MDVEHVDNEGRLHRIDGPAVVQSNDDGTDTLVQWWRHGVLHRADGGPAFVRTTPGRERLEWHVDGLLHRVDGPAVLTIGPAGAMDAQWYIEGVHHRMGGPAVVAVGAAGDGFEEWRIRGGLSREGGPSCTQRGVPTHDGRRHMHWSWTWHLDWLTHRTDGPATQVYYSDGTVQVDWALCGDVHRVDGPANVMGQAESGTWRWTVVWQINDDMVACLDGLVPQPC